MPLSMVLDCATSRELVLSLGDDQLRGSYEVVERHSHSLLPKIAELAGENRAAWPKWQGLLVGRGPGSFTGVRLAMATARALAQSIGAVVATVSSLDLAAWLHLPLYESAERLYMPFWDGRKGRIYAAGYDGRARRLLPPGDFEPRELISQGERMAQGRELVFFCPEPRWYDFEYRNKPELSHRGVERLAPIPFTELHERFQGKLAQLAEQGAFGHYSLAEPDYLREADAVEARKKALSQEANFT